MVLHVMRSRRRRALELAALMLKLQSPSFPGDSLNMGGAWQILPNLKLFSLQHIGNPPAQPFCRVHRECPKAVFCSSSLPLHLRSKCSPFFYPPPLHNNLRDLPSSFLTPLPVHLTLPPPHSTSHNPHLYLTRFPSPFRFVKTFAYDHRSSTVCFVSTRLWYLLPEPICPHQLR